MKKNKEDFLQREENESLSEQMTQLESIHKTKQTLQNNGQGTRAIKAI